VAVSSVTGGKVPVHFKVVAFEEQERSSSLRRWMRRGPHALCVHVGCAGAMTSVSSYARLESGDRRLCVRGSRLFTLWRRSSSGHSGLQRTVVLSRHSGGIIGAILGAFSLASLPR
jgi:hypothetical protein